MSADNTGAGLKRGDRVPHFRVTDVDDALFDYGSIWQRRHLLLVVVEAQPAPDVAATVDGLRARLDEIRELEAQLVVTRDAVRGVTCPGIVIADRWGEVFAAADAASWMTDTDAIEWLRSVHFRC